MSQAQTHAKDGRFCAASDQHAVITEYIACGHVAGRSKRKPRSNSFASCVIAIPAYGSAPLVSTCQQSLRFGVSNVSGSNHKTSAETGTLRNVRGVSRSSFPLALYNSHAKGPDVALDGEDTVLQTLGCPCPCVLRLNLCAGATCAAIQVHTRFVHVSRELCTKAERE